ncbi:class I SAM-dependent methyltransferase [Kitasatospora sp. KL5]|uniref:class I SAM-dependent methyltransferase n=1 Tax=Kitasatospora sp. KL5 TaxID=3425125 RepID=UPI003D6E697F
MSSFEYPGEFYEVIRKDFRDLATETEFLASYLPPGGRVLDIGSATGANLRALAALGHPGTGLDQSAAAAAAAAGDERER